jgi:hypothetical protein
VLTLDQDDYGAGWEMGAYVYEGSVSPVISFSCSPITVVIGQTITCSCSATDDVDSSPDVSYTANPSTSEIGTLTTTCTATDDSGNSASSSISYYVISSGGAGEPPFYTNTFLMDEKEFSEMGSITQLLSVKERIRIKIDGQEHYVGIRTLGSTTANMEVSSTSQQVIFNIGDENKFDVTGDDFYDLSVILNSIESNKANITLTSISGESVVEEPEEGEEGILGDIVGKSTLKFWLILGVIVLIIVVVVVISMILKKKKGNEEA